MCDVEDIWLYLWDDLLSADDELLVHDLMNDPDFLSAEDHLNYGDDELFGCPIR